MSQMPSMQLSLTDIARLAAVRRPVVSMWRRRELADHPFPQATTTSGGDERFDALAIVEYLEGTSRGNNPDARADLAAHVRPILGNRLDNGTLFDGLTALLCLAAITGENLGGRSAADVRHLATQADPDDVLLGREIAAIDDDLAALASHADALADASYSAASAFEGLLRRGLQGALPGQAAVELRPIVHTLAARVASGLAAQAALESPVFIDVTDGSCDLLLATALAYAAQSAPSVASPGWDTRTARLARRRLRVHDLHRLDLKVDEGEVQIPVAIEAAHVLQVPSAGRPSMRDAEVLRVVDEVALSLTGRQCAVVLGPASALTDRPGSAEVDLARDAILRTGRLRAAVRLPKGLLVRSPRQALALWVLGPAHPSVPAADRWTVVADLTNSALTDTVVDGVVTDVVAAMTPDDHSIKAGMPAGAVIDDVHQVRGHQLRYGRRVATSSLLPGRRPLVDTSTVQRHAASGSDLAVTIERLVQGLPQSALADLRVDVVGDDALPEAAASKTLGQLVAEGACRMVPGNRVDLADITSGDGRLVIGPGELLGQRPIGERRIDLLTFAGSYASARFTEPGDVLFCTSPDVAARVDRDGGSVVVSPARVLRIGPRGQRSMLPETLALDIRAIAAESGDGSNSAAKDWRRWRIRLTLPDQREALATALAAVERERTAALDRLKQLDVIEENLADGVTSNSLTITTPPRAEGP